MNRSTKKQQKNNNNNTPPPKKKKKKKKKKKITKNTWTQNEGSDQPDHPSSLNRILDSSCELIMGSQEPNAFSREQRILLK